MKQISLLIIVAVLSLQVFGQENIATEKGRTKNSIYTEFGGNGLYYSQNYDRVFFGKGIIHFVTRIGISVIPHDDSKNSMLVYPLIELNILLGKKNNFLELGAGETLEPTKHSGESVYTILRFGYRFQREKRGMPFMFRVAFTPVFAEEFYPSVGLSFGFSF